MGRGFFDYRSADRRVGASSRISRVRVGLGLVLLLASAALPSAASDPRVDLIGTWFVLIHYQDDNHHPERERWDERVWVFERKGSRLKWQEFAQPVFANSAGRWDYSLGRKAKELHFWEPNAAQLHEIREGLPVSERGVVKKSLRRADDGSWRTISRASRASASVISFEKHWNVDDPEGLPVFQQKDVLGGEAAEDMDGVTRFSTREIEPGGGVLRGDYERDGTRHGSFRLIRSGGTKEVSGSGLTQDERVKQQIRNAIEQEGESRP